MNYSLRVMKIGEGKWAGDTPHRVNVTDAQRRKPEKER